MALRTLLVVAMFGILAPTAGALAQQREPNAPDRPTLTSQQAMERFTQGGFLEHRKDMHGALVAYLEAGEAGYAPAQKKLGDLYSTGNSAVERDYETALKWYEKAREQGMDIPKPLTYQGLR